jgi:hypothetical protein
MKQKLATPPLPNAFDWNDNFKWVAMCISGLIAYCYYIAFYFKNKAKEKEEFIQGIVNATLRSTLDHELQSIKDNIDKLFEYREDDRKHIDEKFTKLMAEVRK